MLSLNENKRIIQGRPSMRHLNPGPQGREAGVPIYRKKFVLDSKINLSKNTKLCEEQFCNRKIHSETHTERLLFRNAIQSALQLLILRIFIWIQAPPPPVNATARYKTVAI